MSISSGFKGAGRPTTRELASSGSMPASSEAAPRKGSVAAQQTAPTASGQTTASAVAGPVRRTTALAARRGKTLAPQRGRGLRRLAVIAGLAGALCVTVLAALTIGPVPTPLGDALAAIIAPAAPLLETVGIHLNVPAEATTSLVWTVRLPRILLALVVGAGLAAAGAVMQAVFRNPLAEPGITGVSSGAAIVAVLVIVSGAASVAPWLLPVGAFAGALITVAVVQVIAGRRGGAATLLLVGIALNALLGAGISAIVVNAPSSDDAQQAMFWLNGDLTAANWGDLGLAIIPIVLGTVCLVAFVPELNMFLLSEESAAAAGVNTGVTRHVLLALAALVTAAGVAVTGVISFVGLVVPHIVRLVLGPDHRALMPVSIVGGGIFLVLADLVARNLFSPVALQTGTVTAFIGAPVLLVLVLRRARA